MERFSGYINKLWDDVLILLQTDLDYLVFDSFFKTSTLHQITNDNTVIISVPTNTQKLVFTQHLQLIEEKVGQVFEDQYKIEVYYEKELESIGEIPKQFMQLPLDVSHVDNIQSQFTFDNFVVGDSNRESHSSSLATALAPGKYYNPLFIFGNSGLGKTHLLHSIGNYVKENSPNLKVLYITSNDFITKVVNSFRDNSIEEFKQDMYKLDVFLVDDIQFLAGKDKSHEIFFYIFNELVNNRKQIVLTSDKHPSELHGLEERLISRFVSGLSVGLDSPEFEVARAILYKKLENQAMDPDIIDEDVLSYLASNFSRDVRKLEGALNRLIFYSINFSDSPRITMEVAMQAFQNQSTGIVDVITIDAIKKSVASYYGLTTKQLNSKSRTKIIANARHIAMYLSRKHLDLSFSRIGEDFGKRDHSTVVSACDKIEKLASEEVSYQIALQEIEKILIKK